MSSPTPISTWSDRRGLSQKGREVHTPSDPAVRRFHETGVGEAIRRASTSSSNGSPLEKVPTSGSSGRRRSSAGSSSGLFGNLNTMKRGSQDYSDRRASQTDMMSQGGRMSGWFNSTFRGIQRPAAAADAGSSQQQQQQQQQMQAQGLQQQADSNKRGVME